MAWSEIRNNYEEEIEGQGTTIFIDAWETTDGDEEGKVIAHIYLNEGGEAFIEYKDERAKKDTYAQEMIEESIKLLKEEQVSTYIMVWVDEEEKWYHFMNDFNKNQFEHGFVDYSVVVKNEYIIHDNFKADNEGKKFADCYNTSFWNIAIN